MVGRILVLGALATTLAACAVERRTVVGQDACMTYGFAAGSPQYWQCQTREADARRLGRMRAGYAQAQLAADSQNACRSYGLTPYTEAYERCVRAEVTYRQPA
jgi:hypothetical protein